MHCLAVESYPAWSAKHGFMVNQQDTTNGQSTCEAPGSPGVSRLCPCRLHANILKQKDHEQLAEKDAGAPPAPPIHTIQIMRLEAALLEADRLQRQTAQQHAAHAVNCQRWPQQHET